MNVKKFEIPFEYLHFNDEDPDLVASSDEYFSGNSVEVLGILEELSRQGNVTAIFRYANVLSNSHFLSEAEYFWRIAISAGHTGAANNLANQLKDQDRRDEAKRLYLLSANSGESDGLFNLGLMADEDEDHDEAERLFIRAVEAGHGVACANLAHRYFKEGQFEKAFHFADIGVAREDFFSSSVLAIHYFDSDEWQKSLDSIYLAEKTDGAEDRPQYKDLLNLKAVCLLNLNRFREAEEVIEMCRIVGSSQYLELLDLQAGMLSLSNSSNKTCPSCEALTNLDNLFCVQCGFKLRL